MIATVTHLSPHLSLHTPLSTTLSPQLSPHLSPHIFRAQDGDNKLGIVLGPDMLQAVMATVGAGRMKYIFIGICQEVR